MMKKCKYAITPSARTCALMWLVFGFLMLLGGMICSIELGAVVTGDNEQSYYHETGEFNMNNVRSNLSDTDFGVNTTTITYGTGDDAQSIVLNEDVRNLEIPDDGDIDAFTLKMYEAFDAEGDDGFKDRIGDARDFAETLIDRANNVREDDDAVVRVADIVSGQNDAEFGTGKITELTIENAKDDFNAEFYGTRFLSGFLTVTGAFSTLGGLWKCTEKPKKEKKAGAPKPEKKIQKWRKEINHGNRIWVSFAWIVLMILCAIVVVAGQLGTYGANSGMIVGIFLAITFVSFIGSAYRMIKPGKAPSKVQTSSGSSPHNGLYTRNEMEYYYQEPIWGRYGDRNDGFRGPAGYGGRRDGGSRRLVTLEKILKL